MQIRIAKKKNRIRKLFCLAVLMCGLWQSVEVEAAENTKAPTRIDNFTGQMITNTQTEKEEVQVYSNCSYNINTQKFIYTVDETAGLQVKSSVADGMISNKSVSLEFAKGQDFVLYKDGTKFEEQDLSSIKKIGSYVLQYKGKKVLEFRVLGEYSTLDVFNAPNGFYIKDVLLEGKPAQFSYQSVKLSGEGAYEVVYVCEATEKVYSFKTIVDRTAPKLVLEELDKKGRARGPVDVSDREANSTLKILLDGQEQKVSNTLTKSGDYIVTISDRAGNYNTYKFTIMIYFNTSSITFLALVLAVVLGITAYIVISAKRLKVF